MQASGFALVVEGSGFMRHLISDAVREFYPRMVVASTKDETLAAMANRPSFAVVDLPPDSESCLDALNLLSLMRKLDSDMPILCVSAMEQAWVKRLAMRSGASDFLPKPFSMAEFNQVVRGLLGQQTEINKVIAN